jgi:hypothetical protein
VNIGDRWLKDGEKDIIVEMDDEFRRVLEG